MTERGEERLVVRRLPPAAAGAVLLLHGGYEQDTRAPSRLNVPALRMRPFATAVARAAGGRGVAVAEARYRYRGWNGGRADAARDAAEAVERLAELTGGAPTVLIGHSMGGRAALRAAGAAHVAGVVALAPWCPPGEPVAQLAHRRLVFAHATADRVTSPAESLRMAADARAAGAQVARYELPGGDHAMLRRMRAWHRFAALGAAALLGLAPVPAEMSAAFARSPGDPDGLALPLPRAASPRSSP
ncbi:alpha/beta fold hydrolase [Streptomyces sp. NPDC087270]|uniref:alpha/beta fold hydrolase n=1 Tax=Streptomyces sp. NPDC087270 TaxID=3365774 RepID=UPI00380B6E02